MSSVPPPAAAVDSADLLRFACSHCGTGLEVPPALAGISGPCPACRALITAPPAPPPHADEGATPGPADTAAALLSRPPPVRHLPPPLPLVSGATAGPVSSAAVPPAAFPPPAGGQWPTLENRLPPARALPGPAGRPGPSVTEAGISPDALLAAQPHGLAITPVSAEDTFCPGPANAAAEWERGIFADEAVLPPHGRSGSRRRAASTFRPGRWRRLADLVLISVFTGLVGVTVAALRFTVPVEKTAGVPNLPPNLNELVEQEARSMDLRRMEAVELARAAVGRYLGAASEQAAVSHLLPPPGGMALPPFPPFSPPPPAGFHARFSRRIAGTDRFLVVVEPQGQPGPVFIVEQTESGPRLHAGAITQQSAGLFQKFVTAPGEGEATLYAEVRPAHPEGERLYRSQRPDLKDFAFVDMHSAFPGPDLKDFIACLRPGSAPARSFARRAHDPAWRPVIVRVRWQQHRESGPFAEIMEFIPGPWSGERTEFPPMTVTATAAN